MAEMMPRVFGGLTLRVKAAKVMPPVDDGSVTERPRKRRAL